jgi:hypothetical protein
MQYHSLAPMYYRGAAAAIVVYDITRKVSVCAAGGEGRGGAGAGADGVCVAWLNSNH